MSSTFSPYNPAKKGVIEVPPSMISESIKRIVDRELASIPKGKAQVAKVSIDLSTGVNLAYAAKFNDTWQVVAWVGSNWSGDIEGGAQVQWSK